MNAFGVKNSQEVLPGYIFFSMQGKNVNGNMFIEDAVFRGASKIVVQKDNPLNEKLSAELASKKIPVEYVDNIYFSFSECIQNAYGHLCRGITFFGITGTKGKTSTVHIIYHMLKTIGYSVALMSSSGHKINDIQIKNNLTTEMINDVYAFIKMAKEQGVKYIVIEVSAHAFTQFRVLGITFAGFIFNNFSQEHQEMYLNENDYFLAKCQLYNYVDNNGYVILNKDDTKSLLSEEYYRKNNKKNIHIRYYKYIKDEMPEYIYNTAYFQLIVNTLTHSKMMVRYKGKQWIFDSKIAGVHYVSNIVSALIMLYEVLLLSDIELKKIIANMNQLPKLCGRNEQYTLHKNKIVIIDKAYTPNSVLSLLEYVMEYYSYITVVFGCGGERDVVRRPLLANIIEQYATKIYVTADNPRKELIKNIFMDISKGFSFIKDIYFIYDREKAICQAITQAPNSSLILLLGKGDEQYQIFGDEKSYFSEKDIVCRYLEKK